eukprot:gb/GEZJ01006538.1/.p1 GENE.gb/GEZJ01006538.1/~~gb/GEZJ01006538.1/.p1  ORF type:complete len:247 (-),score=41.48 gb/GEZJ01006538.1/:171-911(-)
MFRSLFILSGSLLLGLAAATVSADSATRAVDDIDTPLTQGTAQQAEVQAAINIVNSTNCNANICFAVDGSGSMSDAEFQLELDFVKLVAAVISLDPESQFAGIQYGLRPKFISMLTPDAAQFLLHVDATVHMKAPRTFIAPGIGGCWRQLMKVPDQPWKIVLLGDGGSNFDSLSPPLDPISIAQSFLANPKASISAVGVGNAQVLSMLEGIAGSADRVFGVDEWMNVIFVLSELVADVCGASAVEF